MSTFGKGLITGAGVMLAVVLGILGFWFFHNRDRKINEFMEVQNGIQELREDYSNRDPADFLDDSGVRGAADRGIEQFRKRRDEILQRGGSTGDS